MRKKKRGQLKVVDGKVSYRIDSAEDAGVYILNPADAEVFEPRQIVPKVGAWAMISRQLPPLEGGIDQHLRVGRIFYVEHISNADDEGFIPDGRYKVKCDTPWGTVHLWPYEYSVMTPDSIISLWQQGLVFHPTRVEDARFSNITFYARRRGISLADAAVMALGSFTGSIGWFEPPPEVAPDLEAMERRINQWPWDDTKRKAAQKRKAEAAALE